MITGSGRLLARFLRDVTNIRAEDLRDPHPKPQLVPVSPPEVQLLPAKSQFICVASGKGGTGKSVVTTNLACALSAAGLKVMLLDADLGLANAHLLMGTTPSFDISNVFSGEKKLAEIIADGPAGVELVCGGSGFSDLADLKISYVRHLSDELAAMDGRADVVLVDLAAGISPQVMRFLAAAHDIVIVTTPDVTALLDAYATVKSLAQTGTKTAIKLVVNRARDREEAIEAFKKIRTVVEKHLPGAQLSLFGWLAASWYVQNSVSLRNPVVLAHPKSAIAASFHALAGRLKASHEEWKAAMNTPLPEGETLKAEAASFASRLNKATW